MSTNTRTIKATVGETQDMQTMYINALKDLARVMFDMSDEDFENNGTKSVADAEQETER